MSQPNTSDMRLVVVGAGGRMGRMLIRIISESPGVTLAGAVERAGSPVLGEDAGLLAGLPPLGIRVTEDVRAALGVAEAIIDFTSPQATVEFAALAAEIGRIHVIGTTGLADADLARIAEAAQRTAIVRSGNMSLGVNLLASLVRKVAATLGEGWDIEIVEMHHRMKVDAPSGTAVLLGEAAAEGRGVQLRDVRDAGRDGITGARTPGDIGFAALRGGTVTGDHTVIFAGNGERIELSHKAEDRSLFARGAVQAALWARGRKAGLFSMSDVLGLDT